MSFEIIFPALIVLIALSALLITTWRVIVMDRTVAQIDASLKTLTDKFTDLDRKFLHARVAQEASMADTLRMMQAEVKSLEMQLRDHGLTNRENPETVEAAIRLVHKGLPAEQIVNRTGLPLEVVESIILFHGNR
jgi:cell division protein FtsL